MDLMSRVCRPYLDKFVIVFINDVFNYSKSQEEHVKHLSNEIHVDPSKIDAVKNWKAPKTPSEDRLCNAHVLALLEGPKDFVVYCDASGLGLGCVLIQRELLSDYDCEIRYHLGKANMVADALSRKERVKPKRVRAMNMTLQSSIKDRILATQKEASNESEGLQKDLDEMVELRNDGGLYYLDRIWAPLKGDVRTLIMDEDHKSKYSVHPRDDKMYYDLRDTYCEHDTIWAIVDRLTKSAYFLPMREDYKMDRLARLYLNEIVARHGVLISIISNHDSRFTLRFWKSMQKALGTRLDMSTAYHPQTYGHMYGRKCRSPIMWAEIREGQLIGPELVQETTKKISQINDRLKAALKGVVCFGKKGKLAPRFVGPFEIIEKVGPMAYRLDLPEELYGVHDTFHVSNLKKCSANPILQVPLDEIQVDAKLNFMEELVEILEREVKKLKRSRIAIVKNKVVNESLTAELARYKEQVKLYDKRARAENEKVKQHYKELYDSIKITRAKTIEKTTFLLIENEKLKAQLKGKMQCVTMATVKPKVLAPCMYAIDVGPIPPRNRNNRKNHLDYLKLLKESVETLCEIVKEAWSEKPLDNALKNACFYTKRSQELLEYVIVICPKEFNKRDKQYLWIYWIEWIRLPSICEMFESDGYAYPGLCLLEQMGTPAQVCVWSCPNIIAQPVVPLDAMSTPVFVNPESSTQADGAQSSRVLVRLPKDPYEAIRQAYLVGTDTESEPFEGMARTPESPHIIAPPTCHVEESEGFGTFGARSTSSDSTAPLFPDHPLTHTTPVLVLILCRTTRMAVRVLHVMSPGLSASIAEVAAMSDSTIRKRFRSSYYSSPSSTLPVQKRYRGTSKLILGTDSEDDAEIENSSDSDSESEGVEDEGPTAEDEGPTTEDEDPAVEDEGLAAGVEGPSLDDESYGLDDESHGVDGESYGLDDESRGIDDEGRDIESDGLGLREEEAVPEGQGFGSALEPERSERVSTFRQPTLTTWTDPEDGMIYIDVPIYPPPTPPIQTSPSPEWTSGLLPISLSLFAVPLPVSSPMIPLTVPSPIATSTATILVNEDQFIEVGAQLELYRGILQDHTQHLDAMPPTLFAEIDRYVMELYTRSGAVRDEIFF
nr:hypothetical protein [Tanacetum cinerariifolium]